MEEDAFPITEVRVVLARYSNRQIIQTLAVNCV